MKKNISGESTGKMLRRISDTPGEPSADMLARGPEWAIRHLYRWADIEFINPNTRDAVIESILDAIDEEINAGSDWEFEVEQGWRSIFNRLFPGGV